MSTTTPMSRNISPSMGNTQGKDSDSVDIVRSAMSSLSDSELSTIIRLLSESRISPKFWGDVLVTASASTSQRIIRWLIHHSNCELHSFSSTGTFRTVHCVAQHRICPHQLELGANCCDLARKQEEYFSKHDQFRKDIPSPRLVGIEPNPGPPKASAQMAQMVAAFTAASKQNNKPPKKKKIKNGTSNNGVGNPRQRQSMVGAAVRSSLLKVGMSDVIGHTVSWLAGYIMVGNGTLGAVDSVYYATPAKTNTILPTVPILGSDTDIGASYVNDVDKHYARKKIRSMRLNLLPLFPSTANSMTVIIAPSRGSADTVNSTIYSDSTAANAYTDVLSMSGAKQCSSWEELQMDLTPFIAGGSGVQQNEFTIANNGNYTTIESSGVTGVGLVPATLAVSGNNSTAALRGTVTHAVVITQVVDLLDFIGGLASTDPVGLHKILRSAIPSVPCSSVSSDMYPSSPPILHRCEDHLSDSVMVCTVCKH